MSSLRMNYMATGWKRESRVRRSREYDVASTGLVYVPIGSREDGVMAEMDLKEGNITSFLYPLISFIVALVVTRCDFGKLGSR